MASTAYSGNTDEQSNIQSKKVIYIEGLRFDRLMTLFSAWFVMGLFLDGSAHTHHKVDSFFTPWHAVLYSGYLVSAAALVIATILNHTRGRKWHRAIPRGYNLALFGVPLFIAAGLGDMLWHILFGFEVGIAPLLSPTHLLLAFAGLLMMTGALRATWFRGQEQQGWSALLPALVSLTIVFSVFTFFTSFAHPSVEYSLFSNGYTDRAQSSGTADLLLQTVITMGILLLALRRWRLPIGTFTLIIGINGILMTLLSDTYFLIPAAVLTGMFADMVYHWFHVSTENVLMLRTFAFVMPLLYNLLLFGTTQLLFGLPWVIHLWLGSSVMSGILGLLLSYLLIAPKGTTIAEDE